MIHKPGLPIERGLISRDRRFTLDAPPKLKETTQKKSKEILVDVEAYVQVAENLEATITKKMTIGNFCIGGDLSADQLKNIMINFCEENNLRLELIGDLKDKNEEVTYEPSSQK